MKYIRAILLLTFCSIATPSLSSEAKEWCEGKDGGLYKPSWMKQTYTGFDAEHIIMHNTILLKHYNPDMDQSFFTVQVNKDYRLKETDTFVCSGIYQCYVDISGTSYCKHPDTRQINLNRLKKIDD